MLQPDLKVIEGGPSIQERLDNLRASDPLPSRVELSELASSFEEFKLPFLPLFVDELTNDTQDLSAAEFGAYIRLLTALWRRDCKPLMNDHVRLARIAKVTRGWKAIWAAIEGHFRVDESGVWNNKLEKVWRSSAVNSLINRNRARRGGSHKSLKYNKPPLSRATTPAKASHTHIEEPIGSSYGPVPENEPQKKKSRRSPKKPLPDDFVPDMDKARTLMDELDLTRAEMNHCFQRMKDHAKQTDRRLVNWNAAFANWVRKARQDGEIGPGSRGRRNKGGSGSAIDDA